MRMILTAGLWLTADVWRETVEELERLGVDALPLVLPGADDGDRSATLDSST